MAKETKKALPEEIAVQEINSWLDYKKIDDFQREQSEEHIKSMVSYMKSGNLVLNSDFSFTHILKFPIGQDSQTTEFVYKARITEREISGKMHGIKADDGDGRLAAHIAALSGQVLGMVKAMDKEDFKIARSIALFFV